jgi:hypothetical protein
LSDSEEVSDDPALTVAGRSDDQDLRPDMVNAEGQSDGNSICPS